MKASYELCGELNEQGKACELPKGHTALPHPLPPVPLAPPLSCLVGAAQRENRPVGYEPLSPNLTWGLAPGDNTTVPAPNGLRFVVRNSDDEIIAACDAKVAKLLVVAPELARLAQRVFERHTGSCECAREAGWLFTFLGTP